MECPQIAEQQGEFLNAQEGEEILRIAAANEFTFAEVDALGHITHNDTYIQRHIDAVLSLLPLATLEAIRKRKFKVAVDAVKLYRRYRYPTFVRTLGC